MRGAESDIAVVLSGRAWVGDDRTRSGDLVAAAARPRFGDITGRSGGCARVPGRIGGHAWTLASGVARQARRSYFF